MKVNWKFAKKHAPVKIGRDVKEAMKEKAIERAEAKMLKVPMSSVKPGLWNS